MRIKTIFGILVLIVFALSNLDLAFPQYDDEMLEKMAADEELQQEFKCLCLQPFKLLLKAETFVFTASRIMENIKKAPASVSAYQ